MLYRRAKLTVPPPSWARVGDRYFSTSSSLPSRWSVTHTTSEYGHRSATYYRCELYGGLCVVRGEQRNRFYMMMVHVRSASTACMCIKTWARTRVSSLWAGSLLTCCNYNTVREYNATNYYLQHCCSIRSLLVCHIFLGSEFVACNFCHFLYTTVKTMHTLHSMRNRSITRSLHT